MCVNKSNIARRVYDASITQIVQTSLNTDLFRSDRPDETITALHADDNNMLDIRSFGKPKVLQYKELLQPTLSSVSAGDSPRLSGCVLTRTALGVSRLRVLDVRHASLTHIMTHRSGWLP